MSNPSQHFRHPTLLAAALIALAGGCAGTRGSTRPTPPPAEATKHGPPDWAPAHGHRRKFTYVHYPSCDVYYDRDRKLWFWIEGHDWRFGVELPTRFRIEAGEGVTIELDTDTPHAPGHPGKGRGKKH